MASSGAGAHRVDAPLDVPCWQGCPPIDFVQASPSPAAPIAAEHKGSQELVGKASTAQGGTSSPNTASSRTADSSAIAARAHAAADALHSLQALSENVSKHAAALRLAAQHPFPDELEPSDADLEAIGQLKEAAEDARSAARRAGDDVSAAADEITRALGRAASTTVSVASLDGAIIWPEPGTRFWDSNPRQPGLELEDLSPPGQATVERDPSPMQIVHCTAEMAPIAKVGGLGDVVQGLAKASLQRGHDVQVMLPYYTSLPQEALEDLTHLRDFECPKGEFWDGEMRQGTLTTSVHSATIDGIPVLLIAPANRDASNLFKCDRIYGGGYNETEAYLYFCRAALQALFVLGKEPDVLHLHEWQTSAMAMLYWDVYHHAGLDRPRVLLTIHNLDNSGECRQDEFAATGVAGELFADIDKALDERTIGHNPERLNLMKGGMVYSNFITTVSPSYAREAREGGAAGFLRALINQPEISTKFAGVLNGIDTEFWCPSTDPLIPAPFNSAAPAGKALCKKFLQTGLGLDVDDSKPLVACITRLVPQKGIHLIRSSIHRAAELGGQFVLLGSGHADGDFRTMAEHDFKDSRDVRVMIMYSERLAHMIYAAADFVIVPSLFEPCGLTQMIAMRYGALPIVRRTGGLADTVVDLSEDESRGNGFVFDGADEGTCNGCMERALTWYRRQPAEFEGVSKRNMDSDYSWLTSAESYHELYHAVKAF